MGLDLKEHQQLEKLKTKKISDQNKIINLHQQLIIEKEEELQTIKKTVQKTVACKLKSYSSVVQESCTAALAPRKIASVVRKVSEQEDRSKNVIVFGLPEETEENTHSKVSEMLDKLAEKPKVSDCKRIGQSKPGTVRPIRFRVASSATVFQLLRKARGLKDLEGYQRVFISPDRTLEERVSRQKLVQMLKVQRQAFPNKRYGIRRGEIVYLDNDIGD